MGNGYTSADLEYAHAQGRDEVLRSLNAFLQSTKVRVLRNEQNPLHPFHVNELIAELHAWIRHYS